ncbi:MAG: sulfatase-like hydrolase/transferase [Acidobacteriota bacterium]
MKVLPLVFMMGAIGASGALAGTAQAEQPNLLMVTIDTWRADAVSMENASYRTPTLERLAARSIRFRHVLTSAPITLPSHCSLLSGLYPSHHGVHDNDFSALPEDVTTLAEMASARGYATAAVIGAFVLDRRFGVAQGYATYDDDLGSRTSPGIATKFPERTADVVRARAVDALGRLPGNAPWHLWVHFYDAHHPYRSHPGLPDGYAGEVAFVDGELGKLLDALGKRPDARRTYVLVVGDHGEGLGDREAEHGTFLYEGTVRVTALLSGPGLPSGKVVEPWISIVDLLPTLASLLGLPSPQGDGTDLSPRLAAGQDPERRALLVETHVPYDSFRYAPSYGIVAEPWKLIQSGKRVETFSTAAPSDAREAPIPDADRAPMLEKVKAYAASERTAAASAPDPESLAALQSLGYVGLPSSSPSAATEYPAAIDHIETIAEIERAQELLHEGRGIEAIALLDGIGAREPGNARVRILRATIALDRNDPATAVRLLEPLRGESDFHAGLYYEAEGKAFLARGATELARASFERSLRKDEKRSSVHTSLGLLAIGRQEIPEAVFHFHRAYEIAPGDALIAFNLGLGLVRLGLPALAKTYLWEAMSLDPTVTSRVLKTAQIDQSSSNVEGAIVLYESYLRACPDDAESSRSLDELRRRARP